MSFLCHAKLRQNCGSANPLTLFHKVLLWRMKKRVGDRFWNLRGFGRENGQKGVKDVKLHSTTLHWLFQLFCPQDGEKLESELKKLIEQVQEETNRVGHGVECLAKHHISSHHLKVLLRLWAECLHTVRKKTGLVGHFFSVWMLCHALPTSSSSINHPLANLWTIAKPHPSSNIKPPHLSSMNYH